LPIGWGSKKQSSVSLSASEAEYIALSLAIQEGKWVHRLLCEISIVNGAASPELVVLEDNQSCIEMIENSIVNHGRAKHIDIECHHTRDEAKRGEVEVEYCSTWTMVVDASAKGLPEPRHAQLASDTDIKSCWRR